MSNNDFKFLEDDISYDEIEKILEEYNIKKYIEDEDLKKIEENNKEYITNDEFEKFLEENSLEDDMISTENFYNYFKDENLGIPENKKRKRTEDHIYNCKYCKYKTNNINELNSHINIHLGINPFKCDKCDFNTTSLEDLEKHKKYHKKICHKCGYFAENLEELKEHKAKNHKIKDPAYKCYDCNYKTNHPEELKHHRIKEHEKNLSCTVRGCTFLANNIDELNSHMNRHLAVNPFKCDNCDFNTTSLKDLREHKKSHKNYYRPIENIYTKNNDSGIIRKSTRKSTRKSRRKSTRKSTRKSRRKSRRKSTRKSTRKK